MYALVTTNHMSEDLIQRTTSKDYKDIVKTKVRYAAFRELNDIKAGHTKVKDNIYINLNKPQEYIISKEFTNRQCYLLFALRSPKVKGIKENFKQMYSDNTLCPVCERSSDNQEHVIKCQVLQDIQPLKEDVEYSQIYGTTEQQHQVVKTYETYIGLRDELLVETDPHPSLPGLYTGPQRPQART